MNDINKPCEDNLGGIFLIKVIPIQEVQSLLMPVKSAILEPLVTKPLGRWYDIYATIETVKFEEEPIESEQGDHYRAKIIGKVPKDRASVIETINQMTNKQFIIDYTDNNGVRKIVGTLTEPLLFKCNFTTGDKVATKNGYDFEFSGFLLRKSPVYLV